MLFLSFTQLQATAAAGAVRMDSVAQITSAYTTLNTLERAVISRCASFPASTKDSALLLTPANVLRASQVTNVRHLFATLSAKMADSASTQTPVNARMATQVLHVQPQSAARRVRTAVPVWHLTLAAAQ